MAVRNSVVTRADFYLREAIGVHASETFRGLVANTAPSPQRVGQAFMNTLRLHAPEQYEKLSASNVDPFYVDIRMAPALDLLGAM